MKGPQRDAEDDVDQELHSPQPGWVQIGALDQLGLLTVPLLFGRGLTLFPLTDSPDQPPLELVRQHTYHDGTLELHHVLRG